MGKYADILTKSILFKNIPSEKIAWLLKKIEYKITAFDKGDIIAIEDDPCNNVGIILKGNTDIQATYTSGRVVTIEQLGIGDIFGEVVIFSNKNAYPSTIVSSDNTEIMFISKQSILKLCSLETAFLSNFMTLLSNKILTLNSKLKSISYHSIKQKVANYILDQYKNQKSFYVKFKQSRKEMADYLGIPRPSLSRELINLRDAQIIDFDRDIIQILDLDALEDILFE